MLRHHAAVSRMDRWGGAVLANGVWVQSQPSSTTFLAYHDDDDDDDDENVVFRLRHGRFILASRRRRPAFLDRRPRSRRCLGMQRLG